MFAGLVLSLNALLALWLVAAGWLVVRGLLRRHDADAPGRDQPASMVPRHEGAPQRQA